MNNAALIISSDKDMPTRIAYMQGENLCIKDVHIDKVVTLTPADITKLATGWWIIADPATRRPPKEPKPSKHDDLWQAFNHIGTLIRRLKKGEVPSLNRLELVQNALNLVEQRVAETVRLQINAEGAEGVAWRDAFYAAKLAASRLAATIELLSQWLEEAGRISDWERRQYTKDAEHITASLDQFATDPSLAISDDLRDKLRGAIDEAIKMNLRNRRDKVITYGESVERENDLRETLFQLNALPSLQPPALPIYALTQEQWQKVHPAYICMAVDKNGKRCVYDGAPAEGRESWGIGDRSIICRYIDTITLPDGVDWRDTLTFRPGSEPRDGAA